MKKLLFLGVVAGMILLSKSPAEAVSNTWWMNDARTNITGQLYLTDGERNHANASTTAVKSVNVKVKIYARKGAGNDPDSWNSNSGKRSAWCQSSSWKPEWWGSGHTTAGYRHDPWVWLNLYSGNK